MERSALDAEEIGRRGKRSSAWKATEREEETDGNLMEGRCVHYLTKKRRRCGFVTKKGSSYCGNHHPEVIRIPCPIDPTHDVKEIDLKAHCKKCPALLGKKGQEEEHYKKDVNVCPEEEEYDPPVCRSDAKDRRRIFLALGVHRMKDLMRRIDEAWKKRCGKEPSESILIMEEVIERRKGKANVKVKEKHVKQQVSIVGNAQSCAFPSNLPPSEARCVVEFGSGRGYLGSMAAEMMPLECVLLVDRNACRFKAERELRQTQSLECRRARVDIADFDLAGFEWFRPGGIKRHVLGLAKHLCGNATDLAIRCCLRAAEAWHKDGIHSFRGLAFATCCHHLTNWKSYENKAFWHEMGFSATEFEMACWLSSWAICGSGHSSPTAEESTERDDPVIPHAHLHYQCLMDRNERADIGRKCKQLIDEGRVQLLRQAGYVCQLLTYIPRQVSEENRLIHAYHAS